MSQRFFSIREILEVVFDSLEPHSNATNAQVCKFWSEIALDLLWKHVDKFHHLINILGSTRTAGRYLTLRSSITLADWERFSHYEHRIRELCFDDHAGAGLSQSAITVHTEVLREIARTRVSSKILPNLYSLTWLAEDSERSKLSVLFMHDRVTHYTTYAGHLSVHTIEVARRMPSVTYLDLRMLTDLAAGLVEAAVGFPNLEEIILPRYSPTADVIEALAKLENLETIELNNDAESSYLGTQKSLANFSPQLEEGSFPALTSLDFILHITDATKFFQSPHSPPNLTAIRIHAMSVPDHSVLRGFFTAISSRYPNLQSLSVACTVFETVSQSSSQPWTIDTIRPIFTCTKLTVLDIIHNTPISLTTEDLTEISKAWSPTIETLQLNPQPFIDLLTTGSSLTLASLFPFALNCPKLQNLGLYINATVADLPPVVPTSFQRLKCFHVGSSSIRSPAKVAKFLSCLFPPGCVINEKWIGELEPKLSDKTNEALDLWADSWAEVGLLLPTLISAAMDSREIIRSLEERVRELEKEKEAWQLRDLVKSFK